jgi:PAS domain S-box-containing protein
MTEQLAGTIDTLVDATQQRVKLGEPVPTRALKTDPNYERMLELAAQNARLFAEQRDLATKLSALTEELSAAEDRYRTTVERIPQCLWSAEIEPDGTIQFKLCTPAIETITGYATHVFTKQPLAWIEIANPQDRARVEDAFRRCKHGEALAVDYRITRDDGEERWVRLSMTPWSDDGGHVSRLDGLFSDVTERKIAEMALRASESKLRLVVENFPDAIMTQDCNLRYIEALNPAVYDVDEVVGHLASEHVLPEEAEILTKMKMKVMETGETARGEVRLTLRGQIRYYDLVVNPMFGATGNIEGVVSYNRDITERVLGEQAIRKEVEELRMTKRLLSDALNDLKRGIWGVNDEGKTLFVNDPMLNLLGREREEVERGDFFALVGDEAANSIRTTMREHAQDNKGVELGILAKDGQKVTTEVTLHLTSDPSQPTLLLVSRSNREK